MLLRRLFATAALAACACVPPTLAHTWVLSIGIDDYPERPLPNCVNDATDFDALFVANRNSKRRLLLDDDATIDGIRRGLAWLASSAAEGDQVHIFYSGHGARAEDHNDDEADGYDEGWVTHDLQLLLDDELESLLSSIAGEVYVVSDSCFSGTVTKSAYLPAPNDPEASLTPDGSAYWLPMTTKSGGGEKLFAMSKYFPSTALERVREKRGEVRSRDVVIAPASNEQLRANANGGETGHNDGLDGGDVYLFSSCSDGEVSNATRDRNSAFTTFFLSAVEARLTTFGEMHRFIDQRIRAAGFRAPQHPALFGVRPETALPAPYRADQRSETGTSVVSPVSGRFYPSMSDATSQLLNDIVQSILRREDAADRHLPDWFESFQTMENQVRFGPDEEIVLQAKISPDAPTELYLCIVNVGPTGSITQIFPNGYQQHCQVSPGATVIVGDRYFSLRTDGDKGEETMVAYLLEWNPYAGFDWSEAVASNHVMIQSPTLDPSQEEHPLGKKDVVIAPRSARPGEGLSKAILKVTSK